MGVFNFLTGKSINEGVAQCNETPGAFLIDVRKPYEYEAGHIPGAINIPLERAKSIEKKLKAKDTPLFVYCFSGSRSKRAVSIFAGMGYKNAVNIGGIVRYKGELEGNSGK